MIYHGGYSAYKQLQQLLEEITICTQLQKGTCTAWQDIIASSLNKAKCLWLSPNSVCLSPDNTVANNRVVPFHLGNRPHIQQLCQLPSEILWSRRITSTTSDQSESLLEKYKKSQKIVIFSSSLFSACFLSSSFPHTWKMHSRSCTHSPSTHQ